MRKTFEDDGERPSRPRRYKIVEGNCETGRWGYEGGTGSFLCPPGHPNHRYTLIEQAGNYRAIGRMTIGYALTEEAQASQAIRAQASAIIAGAELVCSELWLRDVYGYFKQMWVPESGSRAVQDLIIGPPGVLPAERSAAVAKVREYFPDHEPREDLITEAVTKDARMYGSYPCMWCGERVQYEAAQDALTIIRRQSYPGEMPSDFREPRCHDNDSGRHEWARA